PVRLTLSAASLSVPLRLLATGDEVVFGEPEGATPWATETVRPANSERHVDRDEKTGIVTLSIADDFGEVRDLDHGLVNGSIARETWTIHPDDPLSASGKK
ncbi:peptidase S15, partial [Mesorhizobium sp. M2D.F.Ca.ET.145.01.1.1]